MDRLAVWNVVAPRIGASFDPVGDGRTFIKSSYGVYRLPPGTDVGFNGNPNAPTWWERYEWQDSNTDRLWQPGEEGLLPLERRGGCRARVSGPESETRLCPGSDGARGARPRGIEPEHGRDLARRAPTGPATAVESLVRDVHRFDVAARPRPGSYDTRGGPDGSEIRVFDVPDISLAASEQVVRNVPRSNSDYATWEMSPPAASRGRWSLAASFAHTWNRDHAGGYLGQAVRTNEYAVTPNDLINTDEGGRHVFRTWSAKAHGTWLGPWGLRVSPLLRHQSGQPFGRTVLARLNVGTIRVLAEPIGTRRQDNVTLVDLSARKDVALRGGSRASVFVEVFNLFNTNPEQTVSWASGPSFLRPLSIVPPRIARIGMRVDW